MILMSGVESAAVMMKSTKNEIIIKMVHSDYRIYDPRQLPTINFGRWWWNPVFASWINSFLVGTPATWNSFLVSLLGYEEDSPSSI